MGHLDEPPEALRVHDRWVCWTYEERDDKSKKPPISPFDGQRYAATGNPDTWGSYEAAVAYHGRSDTDTEGLGFMLTSSGLFAGADLDDCRDSVTGAIETWARSVVGKLDSYTEVSPSGTGLRVFVLGTLSGDGNRADVESANGHIELYDSDRYLTFTGNHVDETPTQVHARSDELEAVHEEYVADSDEGVENRNSAASQTPNVDVTLSDRELLEKARNAANGRKFSRLYDDGDLSRYESHSEADAALCTMLAFWTGGDHSQIDRLFRASALMRPKWDEYRGGQTYGELTIENADRTCSDYYSGTSERSDVVSDPDQGVQSDGGRAVVSRPTVAGVGEALADLGRATTKEIVEHSAVDRGETQVRRALKHLESEGRVVYERDGRSVVYRLK
jgi:putative DNA primase/helicase